MRIPSGTTDQYIYFVAVDSTDFASRETGLSSFTVYRSRNGGAAAAMTTPTINETDATNMPGVYGLLLDEDMTIASGNDSEEMVFHITHAGMAPVTRTIELYRPKITAGNTLDVTATGAAGIDWGNVENASTSVDLSATSINLCDTVTTNTDMRGTDNAMLAASAPTNFGDLAITATTGLVSVGTNNDKTGYSISGTLTTLDALDTAQDTQHSTTQGLITTVDTVVDAILVDTGTTLPATLTAIEGKIDTIDTVVDAVLVDTGTTIPGQLDSMSGATFDTATDSLEAIRNRGDSAWTTGAGGTPPQLLQNTTIATLASQTSFTLTAGSADDDAYNGAVVVVTDSATSTQKCVGSVSDYVGATKTVTLSADPGVFTMAAGDTIDIIANASTAPSAAAVRAEIDANSTQLAAIVADTNELQGDWANGGRLDLIIDAILADTNELQTDWTNGGRLDLIIDAILTDTGTTLDTKINTIDTVVDAILADTGTDGVVISGTTANQIADALLNRDMSAVSDTTARSPLNALRFLRNKYSVSGTTLTVTKEDDTTSAWTSTLTTDAAAEPVTGSDPA